MFISKKQFVFQQNRSCYSEIDSAVFDERLVVLMSQN
jgi:hypothetical protein